MTTKSIKLNDKKEINALAKGTILKNNKDLFIVALIKDGDNSQSKIQNSLFYNDPQKYVSSNLKFSSNPLYNLVSLTSGSLYFTNSQSLQDIHRLAVDYKFEIVKAIEITELV